MSQIYITMITATFFANYLTLALDIHPVVVFAVWGRLSSHNQYLLRNADDDKIIAETVNTLTDLGFVSEGDALKKEDGYGGFVSVRIRTYDPREAWISLDVDIYIIIVNVGEKIKELDLRKNNIYNWSLQIWNFISPFQRVKISHTIKPGSRVDIPLFIKTVLTGPAPGSLPAVKDFCRDWTVI